MPSTTAVVPLPKMKKNESLKSFLEDDELMKWLKFVLENVEFPRLVPVLSSSLSMEQLDELISVKGAEEEADVEKEEEDDARDESTPILPEVSLGREPNEESHEDETESAKDSIDDNEQNNDFDEILDHMKHPEREEPERKRRRKSPVTKSGLQKAKKAPERTYCTPCQKDMHPLTLEDLEAHNLIYHPEIKSGIQKAKKAPEKTSAKTQRDQLKALLNDEKAFDKAIEAEKDIQTCPGPFQCSTCPKQYQIWAYMRRHSQKCTMKAKEAPVKAEKTQMMAEKAQLINAEKAPVEDSSGIQECNECSKVFQTEGALRNHMEFDHRLSFECSTCLKRYQTMRSLKEHINRTHNNEEQYLCNTCGKVLKSKGSLEDHTRTHTGEKPFPCPRCSYRGSSTSLLAHHKKRVHNLKTIRTLAFAWET